MSCMSVSVYSSLGVIGRLCTVIVALPGHLFDVSVLRPRQPIWVISSAVSLLNHTFTGQAKRLTSIVRILSPETDNCPS